MHNFETTPISLTEGFSKEPIQSCEWFRNWKPDRRHSYTTFPNHFCHPLNRPAQIPHICQFLDTTTFLALQKCTKKCVNSQPNSQNLPNRAKFSKTYITDGFDKYQLCLLIQSDCCYWLDQTSSQVQRNAAHGKATRLLCRSLHKHIPLHLRQLVECGFVPLQRSWRSFSITGFVCSGKRWK